MSKTQMSLQMVVGLVILLVVAVVIIRIFLTKMTGMDKPEQDMKEIIRDLGFESECERLCSKYLSEGSEAILAKYCYTKMEGDTDLNRNDLVDSFQANTKVLEICEDGVYCFHVVPCEDDSGVISWEDCRKTVCEEYLEVYNGDENKADLKVKELFPSEGSCDISEGDNWWDMYFGDYPCSAPPGEEELYLRNCVYDEITKELTCETNCKGDPMSEIIVVVADRSMSTCEASMIKGTINLFTANKIIKITTDPSLDVLDTEKDKWRVILTCKGEGAWWLQGVG